MPDEYMMSAAVMCSSLNRPCWRPRVVCHQLCMWSHSAVDFAAAISRNIASAEQSHGQQRF